jgi:mannose-6-phosphate isomerase-like protein (cupin superfamily)
MDDFPQFMKHPANRIARSEQATPGVEGYVFDGADGSQMAFWNCRASAASAEHVHEFDEYMLVVEGCYTLIIDGKKIPVKAGEEYFIPRRSGAQRRSGGWHADNSRVRRASGGSGREGLNLWRYLQKSRNRLLVRAAH